MRFQVPQFIETESKIVGPLTLKQFFWIGGGVAILFILFASGSLRLLFLGGIPVMALAGALAFLKVQGMSLPTYILHAIIYLIGGKKYYS